jgi:hypothetical protein
MITRIIASASVFFFSILTTNCQNKPAVKDNHDSIITKIEFSTGTRGYQKNVFISADSIIEITEDRENKRPVKKKIEQNEWRGLIDIASELSLNELEQLPSPTSKRAFDGAKHSSIIITTKDGKSYAHAFDDEQPHKKLQPLMNAIRKLKTPE